MAPRYISSVSPRNHCSFLPERLINRCVGSSAICLLFSVHGKDLREFRRRQLRANAFDCNCCGYQTWRRNGFLRTLLQRLTNQVAIDYVKIFGNNNLFLHSVQTNQVSCFCVLMLRLFSNVVTKHLVFQRYSTATCWTLCVSLLYIKQITGLAGGLQVYCQETPASLMYHACKGPCRRTQHCLATCCV